MAEATSLAQIADDVHRLVDRLRDLSEARLAAAVLPYASRAEAARCVAQLLADASQAFEQPVGAGAPTWRPLPPLADLAVGDMVAVTGHDLLVAAGSPAAHLRKVWTRQGRRPAADVISDVAATLATVRRLL